MSRLQSHLPPERIADINASVAAAEAHTAAEIIPVVASASGRYDRSEDLCGLATGLFAMTMLWGFGQRYAPDAAGWDGLPVSIGLLSMAAAMLGGFFLGMLAASRWAWLRRLITPRSVMQHDVETRAGMMFFDQRIHHTRAETGVLIYISLFERRAAVLADRAVVNAIGAETIVAICDNLTAELRRSTPAEAMRAVIERIGAVLAEPLPAQRDDADERPDALVLLDQYR